MRKKVLIHAIAGGYGGAERTIECLVPNLAAKLDLSFAVQNENHKKNLASIARDVRFPIYDIRKGRSIFDVAMVAISTIRLCRKKKFDCVVTNTNKSAFVFSLIHIFLDPKIKIFVFVRDYQWVCAKFIFWSLRQRATLLAPSRAIVDLWPQKYGRISDVLLVPSSFPARHLKEIVIIPDCNDDVPDRNPLLESSNSILVLGTVNSWKGIDVAIDAIAELSSEFDDIVLDIVGNVASEEYMRFLIERIETRGVQSKVRFHAHVSDVGEFIAKALCVVSASVPWNGGPETFGRTIIEAWSMLKPVIASNCGGPRYLINHSIDGLLFEPGDSHGLAQAIRTLIDAPELRWTLAINGRIKFLTSYTTEKVSEKLIDLVSR